MAYLAEARVRADFGAVGNGTADDTSAIQAAIDAMYNNGFGGGPVIIEPGIYYIPGGIVVKGGAELRGGSRTTSLLTVKGSNVDALYFDSTCNYATARDLSVYGTDSSNPNPTHSAIKIENNCPVNLTNLNVFDGYQALFTAGVDGCYTNCYIASSRNANVVSIGSNWYVRCKLDLAGAGPADYGFYQSQTFDGQGGENFFSLCDFTAQFRTAALVLNDINVHGARAQLHGGSLGGEANLISGSWLGLTGVQVGPDIYNNDGAHCTVTAVGCIGVGRTCTIHGPNVNIAGCAGVVNTP